MNPFSFPPISHFQIPQKSVFVPPSPEIIGFFPFPLPVPSSYSSLMVSKGNLFSSVMYPFIQWVFFVIVGTLFLFILFSDFITINDSSDSPLCNVVTEFIQQEDDESKKVDCSGSDFTQVVQILPNTKSLVILLPSVNGTSTMITTGSTQTEPTTPTTENETDRETQYNIPDNIIEK